MRYLGLDPTKRLPELEKGAVVHNGVPSQEKLAGEIVAAGAMLLVRGKDASAVVDAFLHSRNLLLVHQVKRYQALRPGASDGPAFAELPLPDSKRIAELVKAPRRSLNLSVPEGDRLARLNPAAPDLAGRARAVVEILGARLRTYAARGVGGVEPYVRESGQVVDPRVELRSALASLLFVRDAFPGRSSTARSGRSASAATTGWSAASSASRCSCCRRSYAPAARRRRWVRTSTSTRQVNTTRCCPWVGVIPYADASLVFAVNHTFTDQVTGMGSSVRRSIGRNLVASQLAQQLEETRNRLNR